jgi:sirohydrochlorin cobaltochelatase
MLCAMSTSQPSGLTPHPSAATLLFAHGSRDPAWRAPLDAVCELVRSQGQGPCEIAFLEFMQPELPHALDRLASQGLQHIRVMPLFWAAGKHVNHDLTDMVAAFRLRHPEVVVHVAPPLGDDAAVRASIAAWALR